LELAGTGRSENEVKEMHGLFRPYTGVIGPLQTLVPDLMHFCSGARIFGSLQIEMLVSPVSQTLVYYEMNTVNISPKNVAFILEPRGYNTPSA
jgi:hypothetical protein